MTHHCHLKEEQMSTTNDKQDKLQHMQLVHVYGKRTLDCLDNLSSIFWGEAHSYYNYYYMVCTYVYHK